jgi:hypothetical protein
MLDELSSSPSGGTFDQRLADSSVGPADQRRSSRSSVRRGGGSTALPQLAQRNEPSSRAASSMLAAPQYGQRIGFIAFHF